MATLYVGTSDGYATLQEAIEAAQNGDTIVLKENVTSTESISIVDKNITVDLGGFTLNAQVYIKNASDVEFQNGSMTYTNTDPSFGSAVITTGIYTDENGNTKSSGGPSALTLTNVKVEGGEAVNSRNYTHAVYYKSTGGLTITDCTITGGTATRNAECGSIGSNSSTAIGIYAPVGSAGDIVITNSTITGGYGKTDAEWTGYVSQLFSPGGAAISLHGSSAVTIIDSKVTGGDSNWYNAEDALNVSNQFTGTLSVQNSTVKGGSAEGAAGNYGMGGVGVYTHTSTGCEQIDITGSTISGGDGGKSSNGIGIEYRNAKVEMTITDSTVKSGNGENASGNGAALGIFSSDSTQIVLEDVKLNGADNAVIKGGDKGITVTGPVEIVGGTLENTKIDVDATDLEGTAAIITGDTDGVEVSVTGNENAAVIVEGGKTYITTETDPAAADTSVIYVNSAWADAAENQLVGVGKFLGVNAFADVNEAEAVAEAGAAKMVVAEGADVTYTKDQYYFLNTNPNEGGENNAFDNVVDAEKTYDMEINGTFRAYQILLNNAETVVSSTGKAFATGEAFRVMGGTLTVQGSRAEDAGAPEEIFTGSWGGGTKAGADTQIDAGYFQINQGATADFDDTVVFVHAGLFSIDNSKADFDNTYIYLGSGGTYADNQVKFTNGAEVLFSNNSTLVPDAAFGLHITVDGTSSLTVSDSEIKAVDTVTNAGSIVLENGGSLEAGEFSNVALVTIDGFTKGAARDVTIAFIPAGSGTSRSITVSLAANATSLNLALDNVADGNYSLTVIDGTSAFMVNNVDVVNGTIAVNGGSFTADKVSTGMGSFDIDGASSVNVAELGGVANVKGGTLTDSVIGGVVAVTGDTTLEGSNEFSKIWVSGGTLTVDGSLVTNSPYPAFFVIGNDEKVNATEKGFYNGFIGTEDGEMIVNGSYTAEEGVVGNGGKLTVNGKMTANCLYLRGGETTVAEGGSITGIVWGNVEAGASLVVDGGTFGTKKADGLGAFSNAGIFTVKGSSTLDIVDFASGTLTVEAGTILTDSTVAGAGVVQFAADSTTTFEGVNKITAAIDNSVVGFDFVVNENASLLITRYTLGYNRNITVKGTIEDATALKTLDGVTLSLKANSDSGFSIGGWGTSELDVDNAYVDLGKSTWKNATGTYTWSFTNSYVTVGSFADTKAGGSDTAKWVTTFDDSVLVSDSYLKSGKGMEINFINGSVATAKSSMRMDGVLNIDATSSVTVNGYFNAGAAGAASEHSDILGTVNVAGTMNIKGTGPVELLGGSVNVQDGGTLNLVNDNDTRLYVLVDADSELNIDGNFTAGTITNNGAFAISGESTVDVALIKVNDVTVSGTLKDSKLTFETFDWETGNAMVDGELTVENGTFANAQFRADEGEKVTLEGNIVAAGATQFKAVNGEIVVNGNFTSEVSEASSIELEGDKSTLTIDKDAYLKITGGFYLNGGKSIINGNLTAETDKTDLEREDADVDAAYSTWGGTYAADVTLKNAYVWNAMISVNNADSQVTVDNSLLVGWMSFDITAGTLTAQNGSIVNHQAGEGWTGSTIGADGALVVKSGSTFDGSKTNLTNNGSITVDATSSFIANTLTGEGTITIDATKFTEGVNKVIDLSGSPSLEGKVTIRGLDEDGGTQVYYLEDGDVVLSNADLSKLYVSSEYAGKKFGDDLGDGKFFGINAFADFDSAVKLLPDNNSTIYLFSNAEMNVAPGSKLNVVSGDGSTYTLKVNEGINYVDAEFAKEINIDSDLFAAYYGDGNVIVNGDLKGGIYKHTGTMTFNNSKITDSYDNSNINGGAVVTINGDGSWTLDNAQADNLKFISIGRDNWMGQGILNLNDTVVKAIAFDINSSSADAKSQINAVNSTIATVLNDGLFGNITVGANGEINLTDSDMYVVGTLTNNGAVNVTGEGYIKANVSGNGITLNNATLTADTNVGGSAAMKVYGTSEIKGTVGTVHANWTGSKENDLYAGYTTEDVALTLDSATTGNVYVGSDTEGYAAALTVKGGSKVGGIYDRVYGSTVITGSDNVISYINAKGSVSVENAKNTEITAMVAEGAEITITDSEVKFAIGTSNCIQLDEGTTMTISGSVVDIQQMTIDAASALTLTKSTVTVDDVYDEVNLITNNGTITIDATSTLTADSIANNGTITIDAKGFTGTRAKVIDLNQEAALSGVKLTNGTGYYLEYAADGDISIVKSPDFVYVSSDYNSSTEGWGYTHFANYDSAVAYIKDNAKKATMVIEKTTTVSGNCFADKAESLGVDLTNAVIVKDGAVVGNAQSKWDMTYSVTLEGGAILQSARPASAGYGNTHIKNVLTIGDGSEKRAEVRFINGLSGITYQTMSIALLSGFNRSITANNALIEVGDFGINAAASFTDTTLTIAGILAIKGTSLYKTTMTDTTVTIKGHNLMNENTYYSTVGTILATLTMDNSSITVDDGADDTAAEKVWLGYTGNVAQTLTLTNGSSITVEKGTEVQVANKVTVADSTISVGTLNAGVTKAANSSFYFNGLEKGTVYYAVLYDAEGNELETIVRTSLNASTFYPKFALLPVGDYTAKCFKDEAKTELVQEKTYSFTAVGTLTLTNSELSADKLILAGNNLTMDYDSTVAFGAVEGGYITVSDAASYVDNADVADGTYKLLDYTGDGAMTADDYKVILNDVWHDNYLVFNNDLYLTDQESDIVHVSAEWKDAEKGSINADGSIIGFNAAGNVKDLANMINTDGRDTTVKFHTDMEVADTVDFAYGTGDILFTADQAVTIAQTAVTDFGFTQDKDITVTVGENVTFQIYDNASGWYQYYGPSLELYGTITGGENWGCTYLFNGEHTVHSTGTLSTGRIQLGYTTLNVEGDAESERTAAHIDTNYLLVECSTFNAENAIVEAGIIYDSNNGGMRWGASEFNFSNSQVTAGNMTIQYADSVVEVNNSVFDVTGTLSNAGTFNVTGKSTLNIANLSGVIDAADADLTVDITGAADARLNVSGESAVKGLISGAKLVLGSVEKSVNATVDVTDWTQVDFAAMNGSVTITGKMAEDGFGLAPMLVSGLYNNNNQDIRGDVAVGATTVTVDKDAYVKAHQVYISETGAANKHVLNVYGEVEANASIYNKYNGELNVYGTVSANYLQVAGNVTVTGEGAQLNLAGVGSNGAAKVGLADGGSKFTISNGAKVDADGEIAVGYSDRTGAMIVNNATLDAAKVSVSDGSEINVSGNSDFTVSGTLDVAGTLTVDGANLTANEVSMFTSVLFKIDKGEAREIVVSFIPVDATAGVTVRLQAAKNATSVTYEGTDIADGKYYVTVFDGDTSVRSEMEVVGGSFDVKGESTLNIATLNGFAALRDGAVLSSSKVGGLVKVFGDVALKGDNGIAALNVGNGYEGAKSLTVNGNATFTTVEVGTAALNIAEGAVVTANTSTFAAGSQVVISNADYNAKSVSVAGTLELTNGALLRAEDSFSIAEKGSVTIDTASLISFAGAFDNDGVITVDMTGFADTIYRVVDYTGTGDMDLTAYGTFETAEGYDFFVRNNDLYVATSDFDFDDIKVDSNWSGKEDAAALGDGRIYGINGFASIDDIADADGKVSGLTKLTISNTDYASDITFADEGLPIVLENTELSGTVTVTGAYIGLDADSTIASIIAAKGVHLAGNGSVGNVEGAGLFDAKEGITVGNATSFNIAYLSDMTVTGAFTMTDGSDELYVNGDITVGTVDFLQGSDDKMVVAAGATVDAGVIESSGKLTIDMAYAGETAITVTDNGAFETNGNLVINLTAFAADADGESLLVSGITEFAGSVELGGESVSLNESVIFNNNRFVLSITGDGLALVKAEVRNDLDNNGLSDILLWNADNSNCKALLTTGSDPAFKELVLGDFDRLIGAGKVTGADVEGPAVFYQDGNTVKACIMDDGNVAEYRDIWQVADNGAEVVGLGDFNGDGATDLLVEVPQSADGGVSVGFISNGEWNYFQSLGSEWEVTHVGDFNNDGRDDVMLEHTDGFAGAWLIKEDGTPEWAGLDSIANVETCGVGDFNGDGIDDVLVRNGEWVGAWIVGTDGDASNGLVDSFIGIKGDLAVENTIEQIGDFNGDGVDDIVIRTAAGDLGVLSINGDSTDWKYFTTVSEEWKSSIASL